MKQEVGRLALRVEGDWWVAYYALPTSMDGAIRLGSIRMTLVQQKERKDQFIQMMTACVADALEMVVGQRPDFNEPKAAPEHERAGRA